MSEIRLQCPECGTEYRLPQSAIPDQGRQVECTSCDHIWLAVAEKRGTAVTISTEGPGIEAPASADDSEIVRHLPDSEATADNNVPERGDLVPLKRRVPDDVLKILREEVEFERRARRGEITENSSTAADDSEEDESWPATTVTYVSPGSESSHLPQNPTSTQPPAELKTARSEEPQQRTAHIPVNAPSRTIGAKQPRPTQRSGYLAGFGVALAIAATAFVIYVIAPDYSDNTRFGPSLTQYREMVDAGRGWLGDQASRLKQRN